MSYKMKNYSAIESLFKRREIDPRGKYAVRLFDGTADAGRGAWVTITIDDYIPCDKNAWEKNGVARPKFTQPNGNEARKKFMQPNKDEVRRIYIFKLHSTFLQSSSYARTFL
jgi:hypothetical protein